MKHLHQFVAAQFPKSEPDRYPKYQGSNFWLALRGKRILFHPSCGMDDSPVLYFHRDWLRALSDDGPEVIIRTDGMPYQSIFSQYDRFQSTLLLNVEIPGGVSGKRSLYIHETLVMGRRLIVIELYGLLNEDVLRCFLEDGTEVRYLYSVCDGIMSGMGAVNPEGIPTLYYTYFFSQLRTRYQISEYLRNDVTSGRSMDERHNEWMSHIRKFASMIRRHGVRQSIISGLNGRWCIPDGYRFITLNEDRKTEFSVQGGFIPIGMLINDASSEFDQTLT